MKDTETHLVDDVSDLPSLHVARGPILRLFLPLIFCEVLLDPGFGGFLALVDRQVERTRGRLEHGRDPISEYEVEK